MIERQRQSCLNEYPEGTQYSRWWGVGPLNVLGIVLYIGRRIGMLRYRPVWRH
nr:hypothetical protein [Pseudomonas aeruginosa]